MSDNLTIDNVGIRLLARLTDSSYNPANGYSFTPINTAGNEFGLAGSDPTTGRYLHLSNLHSATTEPAQIRVFAGNSGIGEAGIEFTAQGTGGNEIEVWGTQTSFGEGGVRDFQIRTDNSSTNPGIPWLRSDGNSLWINGDPHFYLNYDNRTIDGRVVSTTIQGATDNTHDNGVIGARWRYVNVATGIGVGLAVAPTYQIHLGLDSAAKPTSSTWTILSDRRSKRNVTPLGPHLAAIRALPLVADQVHGAFGSPAGAPGIGAVADDVRPLFPRAVRTVGAGADQYLALDWHDVFVGHVKATQELADAVERLEADVAALQARPRDPVRLTGGTRQ